MKCRNPFVQGMHAYPCGQCMPCRVNRRRLWTHRMVLEKLESTVSSFVTLTYDDLSLPRLSSGLATLRSVDLKNWLKRFRKAIVPQRIRFYACGEYGDESQRPHYHVALFGYPHCDWGRSRYSKSIVNCCQVCDLIRDTWGHGFIYVGELEVKSAAYIAGYMMKKMTAVDDVRLQGRAPEFARMSLRPGIGAGAVLKVAQVMLDYDLDETEVDVPSVLRHGRKLMPLGRYLQRRLRGHLGRDVSAPKEVLDAIQEELQPLWDRACEIAEVPAAAEAIFGALVVKEGDQVVRQLEARLKLYKQRRSI